MSTTNMQVLQQFLCPQLEDLRSWNDQTINRYKDLSISNLLMVINNASLMTLYNIGTCPIFCPIHYRRPDRPIRRRQSY